MEQYREVRECALQLMEQIRKSTSPFTSIQYVREELAANGFQELALHEEWKIELGGKYFVPAYDRTLFAFTVGEKMAERQNIRIASAHNDFPCFKIKMSPEITAFGCRKLNVEPYGGMIRSSWMDRPLSIAGKVALISEDPFQPETVMVDFDRPVVTIPNLAIHMNRAVNDGQTLDPQKDMLPLADLAGEEMDPQFFIKALAHEIGREPEEILDYELFLYQWERGCFVGFEESMISSPRLDNITSVRACVQGLLRGRRQEGINVIALFDNEEVGSHTKQGAASNLMPFLLERVYAALGYSRTKMMADLADGFFLSLDVAHAVHPNAPEKADIINRPVLGGGVTLKIAASQTYANDCEAVAILHGLCEKAKVPYQRFLNHSSQRGGSTLGSIASAGIAMRTMDAGIAILGMHSARELMGAADQWVMEGLVEELFS